MIWDIAMWAAAAVLVIVIILRTIGNRSGGTAKGQSEGNFLTKGKGLPMGAVVILVLALIMKFGPGVLHPKPSWTEEQLVEIEMFRTAIEQYSHATIARGQGDLITEDWETVRALLEAAGSEMSMVSAEVLMKIHKELPARVAKDFLPGIRMGTYGLMQFTALTAKGVDIKNDPDKRAGRDSTAEGRELLTKWNEWFLANQVEIFKQID